LTALPSGIILASLEATMKEFLDSARNIVKNRYALLTPGGLAPSALPGWEKALCHVAISPALGARFSQLLVTLQSDGLCQGNTGRNQFCLYVLEGAVSLQSDTRRHRLEAGGCAYVPPGKDIQIKNGGPAARLLIFQKEYQPQPGLPNPAAFVTQEREVKAQPFLGNQAVRIQGLLPAEPAFDMALNVLTFQPGATLPAVAAHIMEHGFLILRGQGIFRLETQWLPVQAGDVIWTASYCPQWFAAIGAVPASYICYQDVNRDPM
jgi:(S)-ureidoglycine aminohydrolase